MAQILTVTATAGEPKMVSALLNLLVQHHLRRKADGLFMMSRRIQVHGVTPVLVLMDGFLRVKQIVPPQQ